MKNLLSVVFWIILIFPIGCKNQLNVNFEAEKSSILNVDNSFSEAVSKENVESLVELLDKDVVFVSTNKNLNGQEEVGTRYRDFFNDSTILSITRKPLASFVFPSGEIGYSTGMWENIRLNPSGEKYQASGSYLFIWRKQDDGTWKALVIKT